MLRRGGEKEKFQNEKVCGHLDSYNQLFRVLRIPCVKKKKKACMRLPPQELRGIRACADLYHTFCLNSAGSVNLPVGGASRICPKERARGSAGTSNVLVEQTFELQQETLTLQNWGFPFRLSLNVYSPACWNYKIFTKCLLMLSDQQGLRTQS